MTLISYRPKGQLTDDLRLRVDSELRVTLVTEALRRGMTVSMLAEHWMQAGRDLERALATKSNQANFPATGFLSENCR